MADLAHVHPVAGASAHTFPTILDIDPHHRERIIIACKRRNKTELAALLGGGTTNADFSVLAARALRAASASGDDIMLDALFKVGVDVNATETCDSEAHKCAIPSSSMVQECMRRHCSQTALQVAARHGHFLVLCDLFMARALVNSPAAPHGGRTALQAASEAGHEEIIVRLLHYGAHVNAPPAAVCGVTALLGACKGGHTKIVSILLRAGAQVQWTGLEVGGRTPLWTAAKGNHVEIVLTLIHAGAHIGIAELTIAINENCGHLLSLLLNTADRKVVKDFTVRCVNNGNLDILDRLYKAFPSSMAPECLKIAAATGDAAIMGHLLSHPITGPVISELRRAAETGDVDLVEALLEMGRLDINARDTDGRTCLAFSIRHPRLVRALLQRGADPHLRALDGATPLHTAVRGEHLESAILLLKSGTDVEAEDYESQKPLDIALLKPSQSEQSRSLVKILLEHGCDIGRRDMARWRTVLMGRDTDIVVISKTTCSTLSVGGGSVPSAPRAKYLAFPHSRARTSVGIELVEHAPELPQFTSSGTADVPEIRRLCSGPAAKLSFPTMDARLGSTGSAVEWQWRKLDGDMTPIGRGLSTVGSLVASIDIQAFLSCYVSFEYIIRVPGPQEQENEDGVGSTFQTRNERSEISWTMRKLSIPAVDSATGANAVSTPVFWSEDFRSTLSIGWIPENGVDFFTWFIVDLHTKWRLLFDDADTHLRKNRKLLLRKKGRTTQFIDNLLFDAQQWSNFRDLLEMHLRAARDLVQDFKQKRYLCTEVNVQGGAVSNRKNSPAAIAIDKLSKAILRMEVEVENEIRKLDEQTKGMIELEFNLVSIYEARTSKIMGMSMKRLSWITFIFLPLMFVASLFGMNVDIITSGPHWWWVIVLGALVFILVIVVWGLLKIFKPEESAELEQGTTHFGPKQAAGRYRFWHGPALDVLSRRKLARSGLVDLESGKRLGAAPEFKSPGRQWTKLKDL